MERGAHVSPAVSHHTPTASVSTSTSRVRLRCSPTPSPTGNDRPCGPGPVWEYPSYDMVGPRGKPAAPTRGSVVNTLPGPGRVALIAERGRRGRMGRERGSVRTAWGRGVPPSRR
eukprot:scaffold3263_cov129-Isochrysis_galbana.AAC.4